ncbi:quinone-dependent dihydroorotate dehydrogenase, partial [Candidatus Woesebacteria bacterium]|nr:quinone-dependent dihydroorotate dehydrogenase [Candidatus Woesebacteria bacterium]
LAICGVGLFSDCGMVLQSKYSVMFGLPLAVWGIVQYLAVMALYGISQILGSRFYKRLLFIQTAFGFIFSLYFLYLQIYVIGALCQYCLLSAFSSTLIYILVRIEYKDEYQAFHLEKFEFLYKLFVKPFLFLLPAELVHEQAMYWGEVMGKIPVIQMVFSRLFTYKNQVLMTKVEQIEFSNPVGLAAGYDYEAAFPGILPSIGFGFQTIGTISNNSFEGNPKPRLGRLPRSQSLLVNKGFRNPGAEVIIEKLRGTSFAFPVGISIGRTNSGETNTLEKAITDIVSAFTKFEKSKLKHSYYELNISCPNLIGKVSFYPPKNLKTLLKALEKLKIKKPVFIKMPIEESDQEVEEMLKVIVAFTSIKGVIFGNLQKDRSDESFDQDEIQVAGKGHFSGKPTYRRSNELIRLAYRLHAKRLIIIGCGGVFTAEDAYRKVRYGASLIQLITGMIFEGPQRISQINRGLVELLKADGYKHISEAVGVDA